MNKLYTSIFLFIFVHFALVYLSVPIEYLFIATTAAIAYSCMAFSLILAGRFKALDYLTGGPDKSYVLHRYFGYGTVAAALLHWVTMDDALAAIVPAFADSAGDLGEFTIIALLALVIISILKIIPYALWKKSHLLMGPLFILISVHSFFSASPIAINSLLWWILLSLSALAIFAWIKTLLTHTQQPVTLKIASLTHLPDAIDIKLESQHGLSWKAGQFAMICVNRKGLTEYHPFSVASCSIQSQARFIIKDSGNFTHKLINELHINDKICIRNFAGGFLPQCHSKRKRQIWIAAGSGITPFLAALDTMQSDNNQAIELIYANGLGFDDHIINELNNHQHRLLQFSVIFLKTGEHLDNQHFGELGFNWQQADLYLCGPLALKLSAKQLWHLNKAKGKIYSEIFDFRGATNITQEHSAWIIKFAKKLQVFLSESLKQTLNKRMINLPWK
ncbi:MAG: putative ferric reductase [Oceanospirillaceae bacterium]|jgi:predicted ferric reductase